VAGLIVESRAHDVARLIVYTVAFEKVADDMANLVASHGVA
jgi:hypothetical protein